MSNETGTDTPDSEIRRLRAEVARLQEINTRLAASAGDSAIAHHLSQRLAAIVASSDDAIVSKDLNGIVASWNESAERLFGYTAAEMIGRHISVLIPSDRENEEPEIIRRIRRGERTDHYETIRRRKDGSLVEISLSVSPVRDAAGNIVGASKIARDISQRKEAEATQKLLLNELNHRVKNTLASVQAIAQQTLRHTRDPADFAARFAGRIQSLAKVHSLLTETTWQGADLRELIRDQLIKGSADETRLTAWGPAVRLGPQMSVHLALMLHELGTNAVKHGAFSNPDGQVAVSWSVRDSELKLKWVERGGPVVSAPHARGFGTQLIEQSARSGGGSARMTSEAEGIVWEISVPLPPTDTARSYTGRPEIEPQPRAAPALKSPSLLAGRTVLVVEDEPLIAMELTGILERAGVEKTAEAGTEKEALSEIENGEFDAALLDANLHGRPVDEIAAVLTRRRIPFIFVTGYGKAGVPASFQHVPALAKPFNEPDILAGVAALLNRPATVIGLKS